MIVADAAPLVHLARANWLRLLPRLYTKVVVPPSAWKPVVEPNDRRPETHVLEEATESWLEIRAPPARAERTAQALQRATPMGLGEADAIALAESLDVPVLLEDAIAADVATMRGLTARWTASVILEAHSKGILYRHEAKSAIEDLVKAGLWIRQDVLLHALSALGGRSD